LVLLAIPSAIIGWFTAGPVLFENYFQDAIIVHHEHDVLAHIGESVWHGSLALVQHIYVSPAFWLALLGVLTAWFLYMKRPDIPATIQSRFSGLNKLLENKYYFDDLYIKGFARWGRALGSFLWRRGDQQLIDGVFVNGTAQSVGKLAGVMRQLQTGYLYTYAFAMIIGLTMLLGWLIWFR
jgi:NADH-quinone oxidoreductase subunit L